MITTNEAARRRGVSPQRIRAQIAAGDLKAVKVGRDWMVDEASLEAWTPRRRGRRPGHTQDTPGHIEAERHDTTRT